jgi:hypothetical protein
MTTIDVRADDFGCLYQRRVIGAPPALDDDLSFSQEDLSVQQPITKTSIKAFRHC